MTIEEKIFYYKKNKWNIPFRELHHTVVTVCEFIKPIYPNIEPLKYIKHFFKNIDFDKIDNQPEKEETLKYCNAIYYGLEQLLKADISKAILNYQNNISKLSKEQIQETQIKLIELIGNLKRQSRTNEAGISFTQRYNRLYKSIEVKEKLFSIDYQILIAHFNETITNDLLSSFEIINETFKEITPLLKALPPQQAETKTEQETIEMKPVLKPEAVQIVFETIKDFFSTEQQNELKQVIETGNKASKKLLFKGNGNRLTDTFKKLIEHDFITGCQKQDLINWIISNFTFTQQNKVKAFVYDTVEKTISRNYYPCKSPLIEIRIGQIQKVEQPRAKKYSKY